MGGLIEGLYEELLTTVRLAALEQQRQQGWVAEVADLDGAAAHTVIARALAQRIERALRAVPHDEHRLESQIALANRVLALLGEGGEALTPKELHALVQPTSDLSPRCSPPRPGIPLSDLGLIVNGKDWRIGAEVSRGLQSADEVDLVCSFILMSGVRTLLDGVERLRERGGRLRVLTTTYTGATQLRALDALAARGAEIRVSYDGSRTRLHAKAWMFWRRTGWHTAYVGSSNLSSSALVDGLEWNVRLAARAAPQVLEKLRATFENYWSDGEFEPLDRDRFCRAVQVERRSREEPFSTLELRPYPFQAEILERLRVERELHDRWASLVVAATGTGKTVIAALDYKGLVERLGPLRLLFIAHRREILQASRATFRHALGDGSFGELLVDGERPADGRHVFASIQSLALLDLAALSPTAYDVVVVDEVHHAAAATYEALLAHLRPQVLLGLTATPERADGQSILGWFGGRIAAELRLWDAIDRGLLVPFHYFGLADEVDLSRVTWSRGRYAPAELDNVYTGHDARARLVLRAVRDTVDDVRSMRALGFCVSVRHARFMASRFDEAGIPALALSAETDRETRADAMRRLRDREVNVLFTVDLFNEGVDMPWLDTVLFLRPTESVTVFLQQLGRGLRTAPGKPLLTALDFVGQAHRSFRFDLRWRALTGGSRREVLEQVEQGFPLLPAGCSVHLDRVSRQVVLENIRQAVGTSARSLRDELRRLGDVDLATFLREAAVEPEELYRGRSFTDLRRDVDLPTAPPGPDETLLLRRLRGLLHLDDPARIASARAVLAGSDPTTEQERRLAQMLLVSLLGLDATDLEAGLARLRRHDAVCLELRSLLDVLDERVAHIPIDLGVPDVPLCVHCRYSLDEVMAAFGDVRNGAVYRPRGQGVHFDRPTACHLLFVTLCKSERDYSPSTMYDDYAISERAFHWQSQSTTAAGSLDGRRHQQHAALGVTPLLFVRERKKDDRGQTLPYTLLGPVTYVSHEGERPMSIVWELRDPIPWEVLRHARVAA